MRKDPMPLGLAIGVLIAGILLGSVFTFGMQYWNGAVPRESCALVETQFLSYEEIRGRRPVEIKEIAVDCTNGERYFIDGVCINTELRDALSALPEHEQITLLLHPGRGTIVEFAYMDGKLLVFEETMQKLGSEATGFLYLWIFMYLCSLVGAYYSAFHFIRKRKQKSAR